MKRGILAVFGATITAARPAPAGETRTIAVTIDDLPVQEKGLSAAEARDETDRLLAILRRHAVPAIGFVNEDRLLVAGQEDARTQLLDDWLQAGMSLGNHGFGHLPFQKTPLPLYEDAVLRGEITTRRLADAHHVPLKYYRYPYNQTGPTPAIRDAFLAFLHRHGYSPAPMTIEDDDSIFAAVYAADLRAGDHREAEAVSRSYLQYLDKAIDTFEGMSARVFGRQIAQVFLIHANRLNADTLDQTLDRLSARGYRFITLDQAVADPAYASPDGCSGISWINRWAKGLGRDPSPGGQPDPEPWVMKRFEAVTGQKP